MINESVSNQLRRIAEDLTAINNREINDALGMVRSGWKGEAAEAFLRKCGQFQTRLEIEIKNLNEAAADIKEGRKH